MEQILKIGRAYVIQRGLQRFIVKNIEGEETEANNLRHILYK